MGLHLLKAQKSREGVQTVLGDVAEERPPPCRLTFPGQVQMRLQNSLSSAGMMDPGPHQPGLSQDEPCLLKSALHPTKPSIPFPAYLGLSQPCLSSYRNTEERATPKNFSQVSVKHTTSKVGGWGQGLGGKHRQDQLYLTVCRRPSSQWAQFVGLPA